MQQRMPARPWFSSKGLSCCLHMAGARKAAAQPKACMVWALIFSRGLLVRAHRVDESHLTGESDDVIKDPYTAPVLVSGSKVCGAVGPLHAVLRMAAAQAWGAAWAGGGLRAVPNRWRLRLNSADVTYAVHATNTLV